MTTNENSNTVEATTLNPAEVRRGQLAALMPEAFSEGKLDIAALKRALGETAVIDSGERYALTWAGKSDAYKVLHDRGISLLDHMMGSGNLGLTARLACRAGDAITASRG